MKIEALLVDAGGVLFNNVLEDTSFVGTLARNHAADPVRLLAGLKRSAYRYEDGSVHVHTILRDALTAAGAMWTDEFDTGWVDRLYLTSVHCHHRNIDTLAAVGSAHPDITLVLANNEAEHWDELKNTRFGHYRHFDRLCSSWRLGQVKPSAAYFATLLDHCGTAARQSLMIDDRLTVIEAARALGMQTLHISSPEVMSSRLLPTVRALTSSVRTR